MGTVIRGLRELIADIEYAVTAGREDFRRVVSRGALNIKTDWRQRWHGSNHLPHLHRSIGYDLHRHSATRTEAEIGADPLMTQGPLANVLEFGTVNNAPRPAGLPALRAEEPRFVRAVEDLAVDLLDSRRPRR